MKWNCNGNSWCCANNKDIALTDYDVMRLFSKWPSIAVNDGNVRISQMEDNIIISYDLLKEPYTPCPMLKDNKCSVYEKRPNTCRSYPLYINHTESLANFVAHFSPCPGTPTLTEQSEVLVTEEALDNAILHWFWIYTMIWKVPWVRKILGSNKLPKPTSIVEIEAKLFPKIEKKKQKSFKQMQRIYRELEEEILSSEMFNGIKIQFKQEGDYFLIKNARREKLVAEQDIILL